MLWGLRMVFQTCPKGAGHEIDLEKASKRLCAADIHRRSVQVHFKFGCFWCSHPEIRILLFGLQTKKTLLGMRWRMHFQHWEIHICDLTGWLSVNVNKQSTSIYFNMNPTFQLCLWGKGKMESMMLGACSFLWHAGQNFRGSSTVFPGKKHLAGYEGVGCMDSGGSAWYRQRKSPGESERHLVITYHLSPLIVRSVTRGNFRSWKTHESALFPMGPSTAYHRGGRCNVIFNLMMHGGQLLSVSLCRLWVKISHLKHLRFRRISCRFVLVCGFDLSEKYQSNWS